MTIDPRTPPLIILGLDAGDPNFIQRWAEEGYLPTISKVMKRGCWARTTGPELISEHGTWVSLSSGISCSQHGYYFLRQLKPGSYDLHTVTGLDVNVPPFWSHLQGLKKKVTVVDVPDSRPISGLHGVQISDWAVHYSIHTPSFEPPELLENVHRIFGPQMKINERLRSHFNKDKQIYHLLLKRVEKKGALCRHLLLKNQFDLVFIVFAESHTASHQFWKSRPELSEGVIEKENDLTYAIRNIYQAIDRELGLILDQSPEMANVIILSSVGMKEQYPTGGLIDAFCRQLGYQSPAQSGASPFRPLHFLRRLLPETWRVAFSRYLPRETRERLLADQFRNSTQWQKTTAFAIPSSFGSMIRINLRGREPLGIVEPGREYEAILTQLVSDLNQLRDPNTGQHAVKEVALTCKLFGGGPPIVLPDLFVEWKPCAHFIRRLVHPRAMIEQEEPDFFRSTDHSPEGFFAASGPSIQSRGEIGQVSVLDLAPTFLYLMDRPPPDNLAGRIIKEIIHLAVA
jgi:predicted AlkP superfamily phosphohydrolase/phosphomutase